MGGSSSKRIFSRKKKSSSPLNEALGQLKRVLPKKKSKRKSILQKLKPDNPKKDKHSQKRFSLTTDKKASTPLKRLSLGNIRKESLLNAPAGRKEKDRGGLGRVGEQIRKKFAQENKKDTAAQPEAVPPPVDLKEGNKTSKKKLKEILRTGCQTESKAN